jgi:hypothetical protein
LKSHCDSEEAAYFAPEELASALQSCGRDDYSALFALFINTAHPHQREWLTAALAPLRPKNTGRPKAKRDADGTTDMQKATAKGYARFHEHLAGGDASHIADAKAVNGDPLFAKVSKERREKIYRNESGVTNNITHRNGTYRENARSFFPGFEKMEIQRSRV